MKERRCKVVGERKNEYGEGGDEGERSVKDKGGGGGSEKERASEKREQR